jgi:dTDP-glucose pyrophosphorylase
MVKNTNTRQIQLILPMAGDGNRFWKSGYQIIKPLIPIHGIPMYKIVLGNLITEQIKKVVLITKSELNLKKQIDKLNENNNGVDFDLIEVNYKTEGPAASVKLAEPFIDLELPVVTANTDQYVDIDFKAFYQDLLSNTSSGSILTMGDNDPKWSFVKLDNNQKVVEVREKEVISNIATVGIYGFKSGDLLFKSIDRMLEEKNKVNNEYYIAPLYNYLIENGHEVSTFHTGIVNEVMFGLGTPVDFEKFIRHPISKNAALKSNIDKLSI